MPTFGSVLLHPAAPGLCHLQALLRSACTARKVRHRLETYAMNVTVNSFIVHHTTHKGLQ